MPRSKEITWTRHARAKMAFYKLSEQRVMRVIHSPKRIEEGVAPKTVAVMQPASVRMRAEAVLSEISHGSAKSSRRTPSDSKAGMGSGAKNAKPKETWSQEIWVMIQDLGKHRKIVSAWRYPGMTRPRSEIAMDTLRREYREFLKGRN